MTFEKKSIRNQFAKFSRISWMLKKVCLAILRKSIAHKGNLYTNLIWSKSTNNTVNQTNLLVHKQKIGACWQDYSQIHFYLIHLVQAQTKNPSFTHFFKPPIVKVLTKWKWIQSRQSWTALQTWSKHQLVLLYIITIRSVQKTMLACGI